MDQVASQEEQTLLGLLAEAGGRRDDLVRRLRGVDEELAALSAEREQYQLLDRACGALDELREKGGAELFWGEGSADDGGEERIRLARGRIAGFEKRLLEIEERRSELAEAIDREEEQAELFEDELLELQRREEERKHEWIVEREVTELAPRPSLMPWSRGHEDDRRFRKSLAATLAVSLLLGLAAPLIDLPLPEAWQASDVPERLTRLMEEARPLPPPPVPEPTLQEETADEAVEQVENPQPTPKSAPDAKPAPTPKGILAFRDKFAGLAKTDPTAKLGSQARIRKPGEAASGRPGRNLVTSPTAGSSGIDVAALSRDVGGGGEGALEGVALTQASSSIGDGSGTERPLSDGPGLARTDEEIQIVFDRHKAALYRFYNRALRTDPTLRGQMVLRFTIEPDGSVSMCELQSSDMDAPELAAKVVGRVETFDFGAKDVPAITILYPIDFLPAS